MEVEMQEWHRKHANGKLLGNDQYQNVKQLKFLSRTTGGGRHQHGNDIRYSTMGFWLAAAMDNHKVCFIGPFSNKTMLSLIER
ncbi:hypothetical protein SUGI_0510820 [Cryptomeria japonica]|nr:hypothetical protein SUGI_0510820 [Cryptomeria japonica]